VFESLELIQAERAPALVDQIAEADVARLPEPVLAGAEDPRCKDSESHVVRPRFIF
jgi:hypothetical protein